MRNEVVVLPEARAELLALLEAMTSYPLDALLTAQIFIDDIREQLQKTGAPPPGSRVVYAGTLNFWWFYVDGIWLGVRVEELPARLFRFKTKRLTLESAVTELPLDPNPR